MQTAQDEAIARDIAALEAEPPEEVYPTSAITFSVRPLYDRILIRQFEGKEVVRGSLVVPDAAREKPARGLVLAVGEGRIMHTAEGPTLCPLVVQPGDIVLFGRYGGTDVDLDDEGREIGKILREDEVLAVIQEVAREEAPMSQDDEAIVKQGAQGFSALAPGGPVIGIPGQRLREIAPGALARARRGDSPIFEGEPGSEVIPTGVKVTVEPPSREQLRPTSESEPDEPPAELPASEPEEFPTESDEEVIDVEPVDAPDAEPVEPQKE